MSSLGERLKKERDIRGASLDDVSAATRIPKKFLAALEEGDFDALPAPVFVTGFLRSYAQHLGLDADGLVAEYDALKKPEGEGDAARAEKPEKSFIRKEELDRNLPLIAGGVGAFLLVLLIAIFVFRSAPATQPKVEVKPVEEDLLAQQGPFEPAAPETPPPAPEAAPEAAEPEQKIPAKAKPDEKPGAKQSEKAEPKPDEKPKAEPKTEAKPAEKPKAEPKPEAHAAAAEAGRANGSSKYTMSMSATTEDVWVYVVVDGVTVRDMYIRAGQTVMVKGAESFSLTTGNAYFLRLKINGAQVEIPQQGANKVIRNWQIPLPE